MLTEEGKKLMDQLTEQLNKVEEKHIDYFREMESPFDSEEHDHLYHYYVITVAGNKLKFGFVPNRELPQVIIDDSLKAFDKFVRKQE